jgi:predicted nuclease of restriction endonuclease-like (RecB) superfamily
MKQFFETYSDSSDCFLFWYKSQPHSGKPLASELQNDKNQYHKFVSTVLTQIQWSSHLHILSKTKTVEEKLFYILLTINEKLSVRELERQLNSAVFERTLLAKQKVSTVLTQLPQNLFKDPYIFEFLDLPEGHSENDLEKAIILNLQKFILEIGKGFTYMGNQFRLQVGNKDYHSDLLFYHRDLQCLVLFELKIQEFEPEFLGKLNFYLEALDRDVKRIHENPSIGVLLCKGKDSEVVEYAMARNVSPAMVVDYETNLINKTILANKLNQLLELFFPENK